MEAAEVRPNRRRPIAGLRVAGHVSGGCPGIEATHHTLPTLSPPILGTATSRRLVCMNNVHYRCWYQLH